MHSINDLLRIMDRLRDPETGCPWDLQQTFATIVPHTLEEAYEVAQAVEQGDWQELRGELGDLLFQIVFYSRLAKEQAHFDFADVVHAISEKMLRRHPHVFGSGEAGALDSAWEAHKAAERTAAGKQHAATSVLDHVTLNLPALTRAVKIQKRVARVGFDWPTLEPVLDKIEEELLEVRAEITHDTGNTGAARQALEEEIGDLLFAVTNLARHVTVDPEQALRRANAKFERRFRRIEELLRLEGIPLDTAGLEKLEALWCRVKEEEAGRDGL